MTRIAATLIAVVIGAAATAGLNAAVHSVRLGQKEPAPAVSARDLAARQAKLAAWSRSLHATLARRPPALPKLPHFAPVSAPTPTPPVSAARPPVTYVQAPTIVRYEHSPPATPATTTGSGDDGSSDDDGSGDDGEGD
jgi:hypothetical protein